MHHSSLLPGQIEIWIYSQLYITSSVERFFDEVLLVSVDGDWLDAANEVDGRQLAGPVQDRSFIRNAAEVHVVVVEHQGAEIEK